MLLQILFILGFGLGGKPYWPVQPSVHHFPEKIRRFLGPGKLKALVVFQEVEHFSLKTVPVIKAASVYLSH